MLIGHEAKLDFLSRALRRGTLAHAYMISGLTGVGKATFAAEVAALLMCARPAEQPCGKCSACSQVAAHAHPDVLWVQPASGSDDITIDQVRELNSFTNVSSLGGGWRVVVVDTADSLNPPADNALLKVLEEPLGRTLFLVLAHEPRRVARTIRSRCVPLPLTLVDTNIIEQALKSRGLAANDAEALARIASGRPGVALALASDAELMAQHATWLTLYQHIAAGVGWPQLQSYLEHDASAKEAEAERASHAASRLLTVWLSAARDDLLISLHLPQLTSYGTPTEPASRPLNPSDARRRCEIVLDAKARLEHNAHIRLTMEALALNLPRV